MSSEASSIKKDQLSEDSELSIPELMQKIRSEIKDTLANEGASSVRSPFKPREADPSSGNYRAGAILHSEELSFLNSNYAYGILDLNRITSHRPGLIGKIIVKVKRKILAWFWDSLLKDYFTKEREFQANVVRLFNNFTRYVDERDASNFWELIRKIDVDVSKALERIERIADEHGAALRMSEKRLNQEFFSALKATEMRVAELAGLLAQQQAQVKTLDSVTSGLEGIISRAASGASSGTDQGSTASGYKLEVKTESLTQGLGSKDYSYLMLENRFRGAESEILARQQFYAEYFASAPVGGSVLDVGCGRGELLEVLSQRAISAYGIDLDTAMIELCREKKLNVQEADVLEHLRALEDRTLSGLIALQVVEHLTMPQLKELFILCTCKLKTGSRVIFETINPRSLLALSSNYFRDPTHVWPLHPDTLAYLMSLNGLRVIETRMLAPVAASACLHEIPVSTHLSEAQRIQTELINSNIRQLNALIYGEQDYCVVAEVA
jgi:2-polyprenyl-3-methyl-5-hydroxy-6-metoxy-1,4-benzoquinol methylase